jgi:arylformamidase
MADFRPTKTTTSSTVWANGSNGQLLTHSNHLGTHLDGEIHFYTPGKDIASLDLNEFLTGPAAVVDLSDATATTRSIPPK